MSERVVAAFRELRTQWFNTQLRSHPPEREWENESETDARNQRNDENQAFFDRQTEEIIDGYARCVAPLSINDLCIEVDAGEVDEEWLILIGGVKNRTTRPGFRFINKNSPSSAFVVFPKYNTAIYRFESLVTIDDEEVLRNPTRNQVLLLLNLFG